LKFFVAIKSENIYPEERREGECKRDGKNIKKESMKHKTNKWTSEERNKEEGKKKKTTRERRM
jgi:hypothetical protein